MKKQLFPTAIQDITLNLVFTAMNECRYNRTTAEYLTIAGRLPPPKVLLDMVNALLRSIHARSEETGKPLPLICRFQQGDERIQFEDFPREVSRESLRLALAVSGMRPAGRRAKSF